MQEMNLQSERLPAADLVIELGIGTPQTRRVSDYANLIHDLCRTHENHTRTIAAFYTQKSPVPTV